MFCWAGFLQPSTEPSKSKKDEKEPVKKVETEQPLPEKISTIEEETKSEESDTQVPFVPLALSELAFNFTLSSNSFSVVLL